MIRKVKKLIYMQIKYLQENYSSFSPFCFGKIPVPLSVQNLHLSCKKQLKAHKKKKKSHLFSSNVYSKISQNHLKEHITIAMLNFILRYLGNKASKGLMKYDWFTLY